MIDDTSLIEVLRCAEVNCDNIKTAMRNGDSRRNLAYADVVKAQIQDALLCLGAEPVTEKVFDPGKY